MTYTLIDSQGSYELVSFVQKDLTHYSVRVKESGEICVQQGPTAELKGWALRKAMQEKLKEFASSGVTTNTFNATRTITNDVKELQPGMVISYVNPNWRENQCFWKIIALGEWLVSTINPNGERMYWMYDSLADKLLSGAFKVMHRDRIPPELIFPDENE